MTMETEALHFNDQVAILSDNADPIVLRADHMLSLDRKQVHALMHHLERLELDRDVTATVLEEERGKGEPTLKQRYEALQNLSRRMGDISDAEAMIPDLTQALSEERRRPRVSFAIKALPHNQLEAFAAYLAHEEVQEVPEIRIDFAAIFDLCKQEGFNWKEVVADSLVHELLHIVQHQFGLTFDELQVEETIERARALEGGYRGPEIETDQGASDRIQDLLGKLQFEREERVNLSNERLEALATIEDYRTLLRHITDLLIIPELDNSAAVAEVRGLTQFTLDNPEPKEIHDNLVSLGLKEDSDAQP